MFVKIEFYIFLLLFHFVITGDNFAEWKTANRKTYKSAKHELKAKSNYNKNCLNIAAHNMRKNETYKRGTSFHSDLSYAEKKSKRTGIVVSHNPRRPHIMAKQVINKNLPVPNSVNYTSGFGPIKNQGECGACWSFSALSVLEYWSARAGRFDIFSEQNIIDCDTKSSGCDGGWPTDALEYVRDQGVSNGNKYKFKGVTQPCQRKVKNFLPIMKIPNACEINVNGNETEMTKLIAQYGPVACAMAITEGFTSYKSGVFYDPQCSKRLEHAVTLVGYGTDKKFGDFYIIRNSWGESWGEKGYGRIARNKKNACAIASYAMFPC